MKPLKILWIDDEISMLKPHIIFLNNKGYQVDTAGYAAEGMEKLQQEHYDVVFLDEQMPGMQGLEALMEIRKIKPGIPVVMITKSEEENIMEEAIGKEIDDYLIKPINPNEIILSLKKIFQKKQLISEQATRNYQREFGKISMDIAMTNDWEGWKRIYKNLSYWSVKLDEIEDEQMREILNGQLQEANAGFFRFVKNEYETLIAENPEGQVVSHTLLKSYFLPRAREKSLLVVIDNLRYDQWLAVRPLLTSFLTVEEEQLYVSILPTATQYARNALFSGLTPLAIKQRYPNLWKDDPEEGGKNLHEQELFEAFLKRHGITPDMSFFKVLNYSFGEHTAKKVQELKDKDLIVVVYNFVDMISHAKTEMELIKELASTDSAYRKLTATWFENSPLFHIIETAARQGRTVFLTTDHGTVNVKRPTKVIGDKETSMNLRYKLGRSLTYNERDVLACKQPERFQLPSPYVGGTYIFAKEDYYFVYPNNYNHYVQYFRNTYQHGGISLQEMLVPFVVLRP